MKKNNLITKIIEASNKGQLPLYMKYVEYSDWSDLSYQNAIIDKSFNGVYIPDNTYKPISLIGHLNILHKWETFFLFQPIVK